MAKFDDEVIRVIKGTTGPGAETRIISPDLPHYFFARYDTWSISGFQGYPTDIEARRDDNPYEAGIQCYDLDCNVDATEHYCLRASTPEHVCIRRYNAPGIWFNGGVFPPDYYPARIWVRLTMVSEPLICSILSGVRLQPEIMRAGTRTRAGNKCLLLIFLPLPMKEMICIIIIS